MKNKRINKLCRVIMVILAVLIVFFSTDYILSEITDIWAYKDSDNRNDYEWTMLEEKFINGEELTEDDYEEIFLQSGLGKPAVDSLLSEGRPDKINEYREYYLMDKDFYCYRKGVFACHEKITDSDEEIISNPEFADLQNGDIVITLRTD